MPQSEHDIDDFDEEYKSKTEIKREMQEMHDFALRLVKLSKVQRAKIPFTSEILECLALADKIKGKHEALRRHIRFMSKVLLESDLTDIYHALDVMANKHQMETTKFNKLEQLRDDLIAQGNDKIEALLTEHSTLERQKLRQLVRQAKKEVDAEKPGKSFRDLFAYVKEHTSSN